jgi:hypothetical protein
MLEKVRVDDGATICYLTKAEIKEKLLDFITFIENKLYPYKDFKCKITFNGSVFCGYVMQFPDDLRDLFPERCVSEIEDVYQPHGGYTDGSGFDCGHLDDIVVLFNNDFELNVKSHRSTSSFKSPNFVVTELEKIVDSILVIAERRRAETQQLII